MIDAYEIGIQLLLQDDVSAGLVFINQGLAEVDRAIAATSAGLAGLVQEANQAGKAVAAVTPGRVGLPVLQQATVVSSVEVGVAPDPGRATDPVLAEPATERRAVREPIPVEPVIAPVTTPAAGPVSAVKPTEADRPFAASVPRPGVSPIGVGADADDQPRSPTIESVASTPIISPEPSVATPSVSPEAAVAVAVQAGTAPSEQPTRDPPTPNVARMTAPASSAPAAITASIDHSRKIDGGGGGRASPPQTAPQHHSRRHERAVAPAAETGQRGAVSQEMRPAERAAAPNSSGRDQSGSGGGSVMLEGRLIGQWMAEHMGREASRPPSGTTFFDPRQTPAWNISGAL